MPRLILGNRITVMQIFPVTRYFDSVLGFLARQGREAPRLIFVGDHQPYTTPPHKKEFFEGALYEEQKSKIYTIPNLVQAMLIIMENVKVLII